MIVSAIPIVLLIVGESETAVANTILYKLNDDGRDMALGDMMTGVWSNKPLVCHITNYVTVNDCANITLCSGGSPVMVDAIEDASEMVSQSSSLVLNIGTVNDDTKNLMIEAGKVANENHIPIVLDPVGAGATSYRVDVVKDIISAVKIDVIKGNAGEISALAGFNAKVRGVDSGTVNKGDAALALAAKTNAVVGMTGQIDYVSDGRSIFILKNGNPILNKISGTGCMVSSVVGCYVGTHGVNMNSVASAISAFTIASELVKNSEGPGTFKQKLMDSVYNLSGADLNARLRMERI